MSGERWHAPSASATPWDGAEDSSLTPGQALARDAHRRAYDHRHPRPGEAGGADFFNAYERDRCPRCGSPDVSRWGLTGSGLQRYRCAACGRSFTPVTGTIFEGHRMSPDDWFEFAYQALTFESMGAMTRLDRRSGTTTAWWMAKLFRVLRGVQDATVLSGEVQIDETMYPVAARDAVSGRGAMGAYSRNKICVAVACDDSGSTFVGRAGLGKLSKARCWAAYGPHIAPGSTLVHDRESTHSVLVERLGLESVSYRSADLRGLSDKESTFATFSSRSSGGFAMTEERSGQLLAVNGFAAAALAHGHLARLLVLPPPVTQAAPCRVPQLRDRVGVAVIESDEGICRDSSLLHAEHAVSFLVPLWSRIPTAVPTVDF